jgi:hypothetical protein
MSGFLADVAYWIAQNPWAAILIAFIVGALAERRTK